MKTVLKIWAIITHTFRESFAKKTFIAFFSLSTILHIFFIAALNIDVVDGAMAMVQVMGQDVNAAQKIDVHKMIVGVQSVMATVVFSGAIFLSIFATASLIPAMLEKGYIDVMLSKPMSRTQIFFGRFLGALAIMAFNVVYLIGGTWLILSLKTGVWHFPYLYSIPMVVVAFAIMFALMAFVGVTTRSTGVSIMIAYLILFLSPWLAQKDRIYALLSSKVYYYLLEGIYHILPKTFELGEINGALVMEKPIDGWMALWTSCIAGTTILILSIVIFAKKDF